MPTLIAITYPELDRARQAMESLDWADFDNQIDLSEACWMTKEGNELKVHPLRHPAAKHGAIGGGLGLLIGGLFAVPVVGLAAGATAGVMRARRKESGIDDEFIASIGSTMDAGGSAIFLLADPGADTGRAAQELVRYGGTIHSNELTSEQLAHFQAMLDQSNQRVQAAESNAP
jgi:uncharacterized membrane protein